MLVRLKGRFQEKIFMSSFNILLSSAGRRIGLVQCFRNALRDLGIEGKVLCIDAASDAPAAHLTDGSWLVPRCDKPAFLSSVLEICRRERVRLLVPTIDTELEHYAAAEDVFRQAGVAVCISDPSTVEIAGDKARTHEWLVRNSFPTVRQMPLEAIKESPEGWGFPVIVKPRHGSASLGVRRVHSLKELLLVTDSKREWIVEEIAPGEEYTINLFVDRNGKCRCAVPHRRIEVRAGEVSKAITRKDRPMMDMARRLAEALPGSYGPLNVQCFLSPSKQLRIIEINARFGGGYPLAHKAGASFTRWLLEEVIHGHITASFDAWQDGLMMLRYDEAVYLNSQELGEPEYATAMSGF